MYFAFDEISFQRKIHFKRNTTILPTSCILLAVTSGKKNPGLCLFPTVLFENMTVCKFLSL